jgi:hypothetical protein
VKLVHCPSCDEVLLRSRLEKNLCPTCGGGVKNVDVGISWQYISSWIVLILGATVILLLEIGDMITRILLLAVFVVIAFALSSWGVEEQKKKALLIAREERKK